MLRDIRQSLDLPSANIEIIETEGLQDDWIWKPRQFKVENLDILAFPLSHFDATGGRCLNAGFLIQSGAEKLVYITDTPYCRYTFEGLTHIMIECNYNKVLLNENIEKGGVPAFMRERLQHSHFSLENVKTFLRANELAKCRETHLVHLSRKNADKEFCKSEVEKVAGVPVVIY